VRLVDPHGDDRGADTHIDGGNDTDAARVGADFRTEEGPNECGCIVLPQPSKPGHATVEPDDMICTHGDSAYDCPTGFDDKPFRCTRAVKFPSWASISGGGPWCCPHE
jgi:hypothetical protein